MSFHTTIKVVNRNGEAVKAEVSCGGKSRGFTDEHTGELSFDLYSRDSYDVYTKRMGESASGKVCGGRILTLRLL